MVYKFINWKYTCTSRSKQIGVRAGPSEKKRITCQLFVISMLIFDFTVFSLLCFSTRRRTGWLRNYAANTNRRKSGSVSYVELDSAKKSKILAPYPNILPLSYTHNRHIIIQIYSNIRMKSV